MNDDLSDFLVEPQEPLHPSELTFDRWELDELPPTEAAETAHHVAGCPHCQARLRDRQAVDERYERIDSQRLRGRIWRTRTLGAAVVAMALGACGLVSASFPGPPLKLAGVRGQIAKTMGPAKTAPTPSLAYAASSPVELLLVEAGDGLSSSIEVVIDRPDGQALRLDTQVQRDGRRWLVKGSGLELFGPEPGPATIEARTLTAFWRPPGPALRIAVDYSGSLDKGSSGPHRSKAR